MAAEPDQPIQARYSLISQYLPISGQPGNRRHGLLLPQRTRDPAALWRNNTGALVDQQGRFVRFGLCKGSSDLIGLRSLEITPELVGQRLAQFVALEVKTAQGVLSPEQRAFLRLVQQLGGVAAACRSVEEAEQLLAMPRQGRLGH
ncbi:MAG: hypothetical protein RLZZ516_1056 [Cyanobacteriota bacterium]